MDISVLKGKTLAAIIGCSIGSERIEFIATDGERYIMHHVQDCCESVTVEDIDGDIQDLIGSPILEASERTSQENPEVVQKEYQESFTWTFYVLRTVKASVTIRWYGESNGYYSESVDFDLTS